MTRPSEQGDNVRQVFNALADENELTVDQAFHIYELMIAHKYDEAETELLNLLGRHIDLSKAHSKLRLMEITSGKKLLKGK